MIVECLKEGVGLTNKNIKLVFVRIAATVIYITSFLIFLGAPVVAAVAYLGMDMTHAGDMLPFIFQDPLGFSAKYLGLVFLVGIAFILYLLFSSMVYFYVLGGIVGTLRNSAVSADCGSGMSVFFREAGKNFFPLFRLVSLLTIAFTLVLALFAVAAGVSVAFSQAFSASGPSLEVFLHSFVLMSVIVFALLFFIAGFVFAVYSTIVMIVEGLGAVDSMKGAAAFLKKKPAAFLFYLVLFICVIAVNLLFFVVRIPFEMVPLMGIFVFLVNAFLQSYLVVAMWGCLIVYYLKSVGRPDENAAYEI